MVVDVDSAISPEFIRDALIIIRMCFKHNAANMLTILEKDTVEPFVVAMWGLIRDEDVEISVNAI